MVRKTLVSLAMLAVFFLVLLGCSSEPEYKTIKEAAEEYCWTDDDFEEYFLRNKEDFELLDFCNEHVDRSNMLYFISEEYEPAELLAYSPYTDRVMAEIVLELYRNEIITQIVNEYSVDELMEYKE